MKLNARVERLTEFIRLELVRLRKQSGLSMTQAAEKAGLSVSFVSNLENGQRKPTVETLARLAWTFGTTAGEILSRFEGSKE